MEWTDDHGNQHWDAYRREWMSDRDMPCRRDEDHDSHIWDSDLFVFGPYRCPGKSALPINPPTQRRFP